MVIFDIETEPLSDAELAAKMPEDLKFKQIPYDIANPSEPDWWSKCPQYSGNAKKRENWVKEKHDQWVESSELVKREWSSKQKEARQKFIDQAALSAATGRVRLIGWRDVEEAITTVLISDASPEEMDLIGEGAYSCQVSFATGTEAQMLKLWSDRVRDTIGKRPGVMSDAVPTNWHKLVTYYGHQFDLPFLFRRCWIQGVTPPFKLRKGRYFDDALCLDLHQLWQMGDRTAKTGGLEGLCSALNVARKSGSGEGFWKLWKENPVGAVQYLIDDLEATQQAATKMGAI